MKKKQLSGFTLVEILIVVAVFTIIILAFSAMYTNIFKIITMNRMKVLALDIVNEQVEIVRNLPYADVGEVLGVPNGKIPQVQSVVRNGVTFSVGATIRNIDDPFDGKIGQNPNDTAPADYKMVQFDVSIPSNLSFKPLSLVTYVAPKNLENSSTNGALFVNVFDANGNPITGADVHIENTALNPDVIIDDVTNAQGRLDVVDVPPSLGNYSIRVTKSGYSTERTYLQGAAGNPNPSKPHATILVQQASQVSFAIDRTSAFNISTVNASCQPLSSVDFTLSGSKVIGTSPVVYKYPSHSFSTNGSGLLTIENLEWDTYALTVTDPSFDLIGSNPIFPFSVLPNSQNDIKLVIGPKTPRTLLVGIKDSSTGLPITDALVTISQGAFESESSTGRGFVRQTDWSGGSGQTNWVNQTQYASSDGNVNASGVPGDLRLQGSPGSYAPSGTLTSSIFDMGTSTSFSQLTWSPNDQPPAAGADSAKFHIALSDTNTATTTWNFIGPDGTSASYFTTSNQNISASGNNVRYARYKAYLSTASSTATPNISDVMLTFTSSCVPPGQAVFTGLASGTYDVHVEKAGYQDYDMQVNMNQDFINTIITISP